MVVRVIVVDQWLSPEKDLSTKWAWSAGERGVAGRVCQGSTQMWACSETGWTRLLILMDPHNGVQFREFLDLQPVHKIRTKSNLL